MDDTKDGTYSVGKNTYTETGKRKLTREDRILQIIDSLGGKATFKQIHKEIPIDRGNLGNLIYVMVNNNKLTKHLCEQCKDGTIYERYT